MKIPPAALALLGLALALSSCSPTVGEKKSVDITDVGWIMENVPPSSDWWAASSTVFPSLIYQFTIKFSGNISAADIEYARVYLPNDSTSYWTIDPSEFFDSAHSRIGGWTNDYFSADANHMPIGTMKAEIKLTSGAVSNYDFTMGQPGSTSAGGYQFVYSEDSSPPYPADYIPALKRPTVTNFSKTATNITVAFAVNGQNVHNGYIWYYDNSNAYVGRSPYFLDPNSGTASSTLNSGTGIIAGSGNSLTAADTDIIDSSGAAISPSTFATIAKCRVAVMDGLQYAGAGTYANYDYRAISTKYP